MPQYPITLEEDVVQHLFVGDGGVARVLEHVLNQMLQAQAAEPLQAAPYERTRIGKATGMGRIRRI